MMFEKFTFSLSNIASNSAIGAIRLYQKTHILRPPSCRFYPSCSQYMVDSIRRYRLLRGSFLGLGRVCRCHPLNHGGVDEVPEDHPRFDLPVSADIARPGVASDSGIKGFLEGFLARLRYRSIENLRGNR